MATSSVTREEQRIATRGAALEAAVGVFTTRGYDGTSLKSVSDACGVPIPLIVYHFGSKLGLWRSVVDAIYARLEGDLQAAEAALDAEPTAEGLRRALRLLAGALVRHPAYVRLLFKEGTEASPRLTWLVDGYQRPYSLRICAVIEKAQAAGLLPQDADPMILKYAVAGAISLPFALAPELAALTGEDAASEAFIDGYVDLCLRLLGGGRGCA